MSNGRRKILLCLTLLTLTQGLSLAPLSKVENDLGMFLSQTESRNDGQMNGSEIKKNQRIRFISPLLDYGYPPAVTEFQDGTLEEKPLLLYLPGFDGTFLSPFLQFPELHTIFDVRCLTVSVEDRSSVEDLKDSVLNYIRDAVKVDTTLPVPAVNAAREVELKQVKEKRDKSKQEKVNRVKEKQENQRKRRPFYIAGESFGGILACDVALDLYQDKSLAFRGMALINPATCYYRSRLGIEGPVVAASHPWLYYFNLMRLLPLFTDEYSFDQLLMILRAEALPSVIDNEMREAYLGRVAFSLPSVLPIMKQDTLQWRLSEWLEKGSARVEEKLEQLAALESLRILLVVGENDGTLPSISEAERLAGILGPKQMTIHVVEGAGHASTCGSRVDLAALFRQTFPSLRRRQQQRSNEEKAGLRWPPWRKTNSTEIDSSPRTEMKPGAAQGKGKWLGMEPRYDNATIGLSPLKYWNSAYYQKLKKRKKNAD